MMMRCVSSATLIQVRLAHQKHRTSQAEVTRERRLMKMEELLKYLFGTPTLPADPFYNPVPIMPWEF